MRHSSFLLCGWVLLACEDKDKSFADQQADTAETDSLVDSDGDGVLSTEDCDDTDA